MLLMKENAVAKDIYLLISGWWSTGAVRGAGWLSGAAEFSPAKLSNTKQNSGYYIIKVKQIEFTIRFGPCNHYKSRSDIGSNGSN